MCGVPVAGAAAIALLHEPLEVRASDPDAAADPEGWELALLYPVFQDPLKAHFAAPITGADFVRCVFLAGLSVWCAAYRLRRARFGLGDISAGLSPVPGARRRVGVLDGV